MLLLLAGLQFLPTGPVRAAQPVGDYCLVDMNGSQQCVSDLRGKWLVINFWASWCPPCIREMPELQRFYREHRGRAEIWGVTFEDSDKDAILEFVERLAVTYPILGYGQDPLTGYGTVSVLPTTFIIDPQGRFYRRFEGPITAQDLVDAIPWQ